MRGKKFMVRFCVTILSIFYMQTLSASERISEDSRAAETQPANVVVKQVDSLASPQRINTGSSLQGLERIQPLLKPAKMQDEFSARSLSQFEARARNTELASWSQDDFTTLPDTLEIELFNNERYIIDVTDRRFTPDGMLIWSGRTRSSPLRHMPHYSDVTIVRDPKTGEIGASLALSDGSYSISSIGGNKYKVSETGHLNLENDIHNTGKQFFIDQSQLISDNRKGKAVPGGEPDMFGVHIVDLFVGFSNAAAKGRNTQLLANQIIAEVNNGLRNSKVHTTRLRLVGIGYTSDDRGVVTSWFKDGSIDRYWGSDIKRLQPDIVSVVQTYGNSSTAAGWAGVRGWVNINAVEWLIDVARHEIGHNAGIVHCNNGEASYNFGWAVPGRNDIRTHMCGNVINFYSNPDIIYKGHRLGDKNRADGARVWRERAALMSGHRKHTLPYENNSRLIVAKGSDKCLDIPAHSKESGVSIVQWDCNGGKNQLWKFNPKGNGYYQIVSKLSNKCLDVAARSNENGAHIVQWDCHGGDNQLWKIDPKGNGHYLIVSKFSNKCLDVAARSNENGARIVQWDCHSGDNQLWR